MQQPSQPRFLAPPQGRLSTDASAQSSGSRPSPEAAPCPQGGDRPADFEPDFYGEPDDQPDQDDPRLALLIIPPIAKAARPSTDAGTDQLLPKGFYRETNLPDRGRSAVRAEERRHDY